MTDVWNSFGPSAARTHGDVQRITSPTLDIHSHVAVPAAAKEVGGHKDMATLAQARFASPETRAISQHQESDRRARMTQYEERLREMDAAGIDRQLIMPPPGQCFYGAPTELGARASRITNEGLAEYAAGHPDRFLAFGTVPMQDAGAAVDELKYVVNTLGFKGVQILTNIEGRELSDPAFAPFFETAEALGAIVTLHPHGFTHGERLAQFHLNNVIGNPLDTTIAIHHLIFSGTMERLPQLKILAVHGGGFAAAYSGRMDHAWGARSDARANLPHPPTTYLKRMYFDTVVFTPAQLEALVALVGADHVLLGTDYPYDMADSDPVGHVLSTGLDRAAMAAICGGNALRLLGL